MKNISLILFAIILLITTKTSFALEDSLQKSIAIATSANAVQSERMKIVAENIANEASTSDKPGGDPYRRKRLYVENKYDKKKRTTLLRVKKYDEDKTTPFEMIYQPTHPAADSDGYVKLPNVRRVIEVTDASEVQRAYEANLGVIEMSRTMIQKSLDTIR